MAPKIRVETYGCSLNKAESERLKGLLSEQGFALAEASPDILILNACAVKETTEQRMLSRIMHLWGESKSRHFKLIVFGCLTKINPAAIRKISPEIIQIKDFKELCSFLHASAKPLHSIKPIRDNKCISIIPIANGCLGECSYCCVRLARGKLKSYPPEEINFAFREALKETNEIWLTAQDTGAYGIDLGASLPELLRLLLKNKGDYRIRIGMMNPEHLKEFCNEFIEVFSDSRIFKFIHLPVQSGSGRILRLMKRNYGAGEAIALARKMRKAFPSLNISTDIITGFPTETDADFQKTIELVKKIQPDIINISKFGVRKGTAAGKMKQVDSRIKKTRSTAIAKLSARISKSKNRRFIGRKLRIYVDEKGAKGKFIGRADNYKQVLIDKDLRGKFADVLITDAGKNHLIGRII